MNNNIDLVKYKLLLKIAKKEDIDVNETYFRTEDEAIILISNIFNTCKGMIDNGKLTWDDYPEFVNKYFSKLGLSDKFSLELLKGLVKLSLKDDDDMDYSNLLNIILNLKDGPIKDSVSLFTLKYLYNYNRISSNIEQSEKLINIIESAKDICQFTI